MGEVDTIAEGPTDCKNMTRTNEKHFWMLSQAKLQTKMHDVSILVNIDNIIGFTVNLHEMETNVIAEEKKESDCSKDVFLAHMAGRGSPYGYI
jgi:hypothetical protein